MEHLHPKVNPVHADLKDYRPQPDSYDLIVNINFLERSLFPYIVEALKRDFLLRTNELIHAFLRLNIIFYQEKDIINHRGEAARKACLVAKKVC